LIGYWTPIPLSLTIILDKNHEDAEHGLTTDIYGKVYGGTIGADLPTGLPDIPLRVGYAAGDS
jgi:hypothetical protein